MRAGRPRTRYILGGENLTHRELLSQIAEECGQRAPSVPLPGWAARALGRTGDVLGALSSARLGWVNTAFLRQLFEPTYVSSTLAQRTLGYRPRPVRHGIRDALRWYQEQGLLPRDRPLTPRGVLASASTGVY
jgi:dihydroflavonol-4-reductase